MIFHFLKKSLKQIWQNINIFNPDGGYMGISCILEIIQKQKKRKGVTKTQALMRVFFFPQNKLVSETWTLIFSEVYNSSIYETRTPDFVNLCYLHFYFGETAS